MASHTGVYESELCRKRLRAWEANTIGESKNRKRKVPCTRFQFDLHSFDRKTFAGPVQTPLHSCAEPN